MFSYVRLYTHLGKVVVLLELMELCEFARICSTSLDYICFPSVFSPAYILVPCVELRRHCELHMFVVSYLQVSQ